jgi:hypothetical protein
MMLLLMMEEEARGPAKKRELLFPWQKPQTMPWPVPIFV